MAGSIDNQSDATLSKVYPLADDARELVASLHLLRMTRLPISLFRIADAASDLAGAVSGALNAYGMVGRLREGSLVVLAIAPPAGPEATTADVIARLRDVLGFVPPITALHATAAEIGDPEDLLTWLSLQPPVLQDGLRTAA
ncbi:MAG TPA: hypothetical protein VGC80_01880 [Acetobacteraceae bacterium]